MGGVGPNCGLEFEMFTDSLGRGGGNQCWEVFQLY